MAKHLQLSIDSPCHENWDEMTDSEKGKFCGSCQKQVIDFTEMTDAQLAAFFKKPVAGSTCGRFFSDQLDKQIPIPHKRIPWVRYFFQFTLPLFFATLKLNAQKKKVPVKTIQAEKLSEINKCNTIILGGYAPTVVFLDEKIHLKGKVINEQGKPIPFASIEKGRGGAVADSSGIFSIDLTRDPNGIKLLVSCVGYEPKEVTVQDLQNVNQEEIVVKLKGKEMEPVTVTSGWQLLKSNMVLGGMMVRYNSKPVSRKVKPVHFSSFMVYSNPARPNSTVYIKPEKPEAGSYAIQLLNLSGQMIKEEIVVIEKEMGAISFAIPAIPSGNYLVVLLNKKTGKKYSEKLIVQ